MLVSFGLLVLLLVWFFFSSRRRHTRCALVTGVQTCALPISRLWLLGWPRYVGIEAVAVVGRQFHRLAHTCLSFAWWLAVHSLRQRGGGGQVPSVTRCSESEIHSRPGRRSPCLRSASCRPPWRRPTRRRRRTRRQRWTRRGRASVTRGGGRSAR